MDLPLILLSPSLLLLFPGISLTINSMTAFVSRLVLTDSPGLSHCSVLAATDFLRAPTQLLFSRDSSLSAFPEAESN